MPATVASSERPQRPLDLQRIERGHGRLALLRGQDLHRVASCAADPPEADRGPGEGAQEPGAPGLGPVAAVVGGRPRHAQLRVPVPPDPPNHPSRQVGNVAQATVVVRHIPQRALSSAG